MAATSRSSPRRRAANTVNPSDFGTQNPDLSSFAAGTANSILSTLKNLAFVAAVAYSQSDATITIGASGSDPATSITASTFTAYAQADASPQASPISIAVLGAAAAVANTNATVTLGHANVTTTGDATIRSATTNIVQSTGSGSTEAGLNFGVAINVILATTEANVTKDATLNVGQDLFVEADTTNQTTTNANSASGADGQVGIAIAVAYSDTNTNAYLDGTAHVGNNVSVTASLNAGAAIGLKLPPEITFGVNSGAGIESNGSGDLFQDLQDSVTGKIGSKLGGAVPGIPALTSWVKGKLGLDNATESTGTRSDFQAAAAISVLEEDNTTTAQIGDGDTSDGTDLATVDAGGTITINSSANDQPCVASSATAQTSEEPWKTPDGAQTFTGTVNVGVTLAIDVGDYHNHSYAYVAGNATVNAGGALTVEATPSLDEIDPTSTYGTDLTSLADPTTYTAKYQTDNGNQTLTNGDTVFVPASYPAAMGGGGTPFKYYTYIGPTGASIDLDNEDYTNKQLWTGTTGLSSSTWETSSSETVVNPGDTVQVPLVSNPSKLSDYEIYTYIGPSGNALDLATTDYTNSLLWQGSNGSMAAANGFMQSFRSLTSYLNGNLGLSNNLLDNQAQSIATGQTKASVAGAISIVLLDDVGHAVIETGASVNQDASFRTGGQTVMVNATSETDMPAFGGNIQLPGLSNFGISTTSDFSSWEFSPKKGVKSFSPLGVGGPDTAAAIGVTVFFTHFQNNTLAQIQDGVHLYADSLGDIATSKVLNVTVAGSGGSSKDFSFNGVVVYNGVDNTTIAQIGGQSEITVGTTHVLDPVTGDDLGASTVVSADDSTTSISVAGSLAISEKTGIGGAVAVQVVNRDTEAVIGDLTTDTAQLPGGLLSLGENLALSASNEGFLGAFAVAGASASNTQDRHQESQDTAVAGAVAFAYNQVSGSTKAYINNATVSAAGNIQATATYSPIVETLSIGGSYASGGQNSVALAGAAAANVADQAVAAFIQNSGGNRFVTAGGTLTLTATDSAEFFAQGGAVAIAWGSGDSNSGSKSVSVGASVALNEIGTLTGYTVESFIANSTVTTSGNVALNATSTADEEVLAVGGSLAKASSGEMTYNGAFAGAAAGAYSGNTINKSIQATIDAGSTVTTTAGSAATVQLTATDDTKLIRADSFGIALAYASSAQSLGNATTGAGSIGVAAAVNDVSGSVDAGVDDSRVTSDSDVMILATSSPVIAALAIGVAASLARGTGTTGAFAGGGAGTGSTIKEDDEAYIRNGIGVTSRTGSVSVTANDGSTITANSGGFGLGLATSSDGNAIGATIGISAAINDVENQVLAYDSGSSVNAPMGSVMFLATETANVQALTIGGAVAVGASGGGNGVGVGAAGAGSGNTIKDNVKAYADLGAMIGTESGGTITPPESVTFKAIDNPTITANAGGVGIGVGVSSDGLGVGASLGVSAANNDIEDNVWAYADDATITSASDLTFSATETAIIQALTIGGAVGVGAGSEDGVGVAAAGAGSNNTIKNHVEAYAQNGATLTSNSGAVELLATDTSQIIANAGGVGIAVGVGSENGVGVTLGISAATNDIENSVLAYAQDATLMATNGSITLAVRETASVQSLTIGGAWRGRGWWWRGSRGRPCRGGVREHDQEQRGGLRRPGREPHDRRQRRHHAERRRYSGYCGQRGRRGHRRGRERGRRWCRCVVGRRRGGQRRRRQGLRGHRRRLRDSSRLACTLDEHRRRHQFHVAARVKHWRRGGVPRRGNRQCGTRRAHERHHLLRGED